MCFISVTGALFHVHGECNGFLLLWMLCVWVSVLVAMLKCALDLSSIGGTESRESVVFILLLCHVFDMI